MTLTRTLQLGSSYAGATLAAGALDIGFATTSPAGFSATFAEQPTAGSFGLTVTLPDGWAGYLRVTRAGNHVLDLAVNAPAPTADANAEAVRALIERDGGMLRETHDDAATAATNALTAAEQATLAAGRAVLNVLPLSLAAAAEAFECNGVRHVGLSCVEGEAVEWAFGVSDASGATFDLTGKQLRFVVCDKNYARSFAVESGNGITLSGASTARVTLTSQQTALRDYAGAWVLWNLTDNKVLGRGPFKIAGALKAAT